MRTQHISFLFVVALGLSALLYDSIAVAKTTQEDSTGRSTHTSTQFSKDTTCRKPLLSASPLFTDLKKVQIVLDMPRRLRNALDCHGREGDCAKEVSDHSGYVKILEDDYTTSAPKRLPAA